MFRKSHKKSRLGCKNCKARRIKCDEKKPTCGNCKKYQITCDFTPIVLDYSRPAPVPIAPLGRSESTRAKLTSDRTRISNAKPSHTSPSSGPGPITRLYSNSEVAVRGPKWTPSPVNSQQWLNQTGTTIPYSIGTPVDRMIDLRLFHHFIQMSISYDYGVYVNQFRFQDIWNGWLIRLSLEHQSLMDALLALSCFHLRSLNPSDRKLLYISHKYMARAISGQHEQISRGINQSNAQATFATSNLIAWHSSLSQTYLIPGTGPPLHWFRPYQGVSQILAIGWDWIKNSDIRPILEQGVGFAHMVRDLTADPIQEMPFGFLLKDLDRDNTDAETLACYDLSINHLNWIYHQGTPRYILRFPTMTDTRFLELLSQNDPRILTIVGYFFMLIKRLNGLWWLEGRVENEFLNVMKLLPTSWQDKMDLAIRDFAASEKKPKDGAQSLGSGSGADAFLFARENSAAEMLGAANSSD